MARYIKANRKVAEYLHLENDRNTVTDGNYLLWQGDMLAFGPLTQLSDTLERIGGLALMPHEAREEQDGTVSRPLPVAKDERFIITDAEQEPAPADEADEEPAQASMPADEAESEETATDSAEAQTDEQPADNTNDENE
jgi:hypothetical protein